MGTKSSIDQLNSFLRGEMSAVETYQMALDKLDKHSPARAELSACLASHQDRVDLLRDAVIACGGQPAKSSGPWGLLAKTVEGSARVLGDKAAIAALEQGEDHGMHDYQTDVSELDPESRMLVVGRIIPLQEQTHHRMSLLKKHWPG